VRLDIPRDAAGSAHVGTGVLLGTGRVIELGRRHVEWHTLAVMVAVGVDACKTGWIAVVVDEEGVRAAHYLPRIASLPAIVSNASVVAIDIPIGLPGSGRREADLAARSLLGARRSSVFFTPIRAAVEATSHADATAASLRLTGLGLSRQSFALAPKLLEVATWIPDTDCPVYEVHPEVSFTVLLGAPASAPKKTWAGMSERRRALELAGLSLDQVDGEATVQAAVDDMLDATVAAWTARRIARGQAMTLPDTPPVGPDGRPIAIWA
jgi:predicted RNase H-like nuclease